MRHLQGKAKYLYIYLWTNGDCNSAGVYHTSPDAIALDTGLAAEEIQNLLCELEAAGKIKWVTDQDLIWVKNFLRHQTRSPKFAISAIKSIASMRVPDDLKAEFETYNQDILHGLAPTVSLTKRECVLIRDNFLCQYCGAQIVSDKEYEVDHVTPIHKGGKDNYQNLVAACRGCNSKKSDKTTTEAGLREPYPSTFHASQALFILKNDTAVRDHWLAVFPQRRANIAAMLGNIEGISNNIDASDGAAATRDKVDATLTNVGSTLNNIAQIPIVRARASDLILSLSDNKGDSKRGLLPAEKREGFRRRVFVTADDPHPVYTVYRRPESKP